MNVQSTGRLNAQLGALRGTTDSLTLESLGVAVSGRLETAERGPVLTSLHEHISTLSEAIDLAPAADLADRLGAVRDAVTTISRETATLLGVEGVGDVAVLKDVARLCDVIRKDIAIEEFRMVGGSPPGVSSETVSAQVNALSDQSLAGLGALYTAGATEAQVSALIAREPDPGALLRQLGELRDHAPATLLRLYTDGATSRQLDFLLAREPDGDRLHGVLAGRGPLAVADVIGLYATFPAYGPADTPAAADAAAARATEKVLGTLHDPFMPDITTYSEMTAAKVAVKADGLQALYGLAEVRREGCSGLIHFGNNKTVPGVGVAPKGPAMDLYKGVQLTSGNILGVTEADLRTMRANVAYVRPVNNAKISCTRLEMALHNHEKIYFHLDMFNHDVIHAIVNQDDSFQIGKFNPVKNSVTAQELYHVVRNWDRFEGNVVFMRGLRPVVPPHLAGA